MTHKILNGKPLKADKKRTTNDWQLFSPPFYMAHPPYATGYAWAANDDTPVPHLSDKDFGHKMQEERR